ncbi:MAG: hypothetical protein SH848_21280 [Saprospiraceae bacterium]|nr:hypothetical protein [Saprospiraceae bacterium]MDZ4706476.1 hypothetical protein [Saprospiraceae bacterium]
MKSDGTVDGRLSNIAEGDEYGANQEMERLLEIPNKLLLNGI